MFMFLQRTLMVVSLGCLLFTGSASAQFGGEQCPLESLTPDLEKLVAPMQSKSDMQTHLRLAKDLHSPLLQLSASARKRFVESVQFSKAGVTGYRYDDLLAELTATQIYQVLSLIGQQDNMKFMLNARVQSELDSAIIDLYRERAARDARKSDCSGDRDGYYCKSRATCAGKLGSICTSNC